MRLLSDRRRQYSTIYAGGSIAAAQSLLVGESDIAICLMGGQVHARRDAASGFSYVNDVVLAILQLLRPEPAPAPTLVPDAGGAPAAAERRVLYVNIDGWHASGVEEAFYTTDRVMTLSVHRYDAGAFPGSGGKADVGAGRGKGYNINLPVADGLDDAGLATVLLPVLKAAAERLCPHCVVCCAGAGVISGDRLGCLNVSLEGYVACLDALLSLDLPLLVLGGGGYTHLNAARAWCAGVATLCGAPELSDTLPETPLLAGIPEQTSLSVPAATVADHNSALCLEALVASALIQIEDLAAQVKPPPRPKRLPPAPQAPPQMAAEGGNGSTPAADSTTEAAGAPAAEGAVETAERAADDTGSVSAGADGAVAMDSGDGDVGGASADPLAPPPTASEADAEPEAAPGTATAAEAKAMDVDDEGSNGEGGAPVGGEASVAPSIGLESMEAEERALDDDE